MSRLETLISKHRINKAIRKVAPRDMAKEMLGNMVFMSRRDPFNLTAVGEYFDYKADLEEERRELREKINEEHPDWPQKAPKTKVIVSFLNNGSK